jgi:transposase
LPERYGPYTTCYNRFNRWRKAGIRDRLNEAIRPWLILLYRFGSWFGWIGGASSSKPLRLL